jgi:hypothetical protein
VPVSCRGQEGRGGAGFTGVCDLQGSNAKMLYNEEAVWQRQAVRAVPFSALLDGALQQSMAMTWHLLPPPPPGTNSFTAPAPSPSSSAPPPPHPHPPLAIVVPALVVAGTDEGAGVRHELSPQHLQQGGGTRWGVVKG